MRGRSRRTWVDLCALLPLLAALSCASANYDPSTDRKIPKGPKWITWTHEVVIDAAPEEAWAQYVDFASYPQWNPFILRAQLREPAAMQVGSLVDIEVQLGPQTRTMWHKIYEFTPPHDGQAGSFCWRDGGAATAFVQGARCRTFELNADGTTTFSQLLMVSGMARGAARRRYDTILQQSLVDESQALLERLTPN